MHRFDHPERRKTPRHPIFVEGTICFAGQFRLRCLVQNFSEGGAKLVFNTATDVPAEFTLNILLEGKENSILGKRDMAKGSLDGSRIHAVAEDERVFASKQKCEFGRIAHPRPKHFA